MTTIRLLLTRTHSSRMSAAHLPTMSRCPSGGWLALPDGRVLLPPPPKGHGTAQNCYCYRPHMAEGTVFTGVCHSLCPQGCVTRREDHPRTEDHTPPLPRTEDHTPLQITGNMGIRSMRGRYASYWNAFLLLPIF